MLASLGRGKVPLPPAKKVSNKSMVEEPMVCSICKNTEVIRSMNLNTEVDNKVSGLQSVGEALTTSASKISEFDLHVQHLLLDDKKFNNYQSKVDKMENSIEQLLKEIKQINRDTTTGTDIPDCNTSSLNCIQSSLQLHSDTLAKIDTELCELKSSIQKLSSSTSSQSHAPPDYNPPGPISHICDESSLSSTIPTHSSPPIELEHHYKIIDSSEENFITSDQVSKAVKFLSSVEFTEERGHSVASYGAKYKYMGSKAVVKEMPPQLQEIMDTLNDKKYTKCKYVLNQCLVNRYSGKGSFLPEHSDDEFSIMPDSHNYTVSICAPRTVIFSDKLSKEESEHNCLNGSMYVMSRDSQTFYTHRIEPSDDDGIRYSLTFRSVHYRYLNSTLIIGDSNTGKIRFGSSRGTMGAATPGHQIFAPIVQDINPLDCTSHRSVVIMVGTNNLKQNRITYIYIVLLLP